MDERNARSILRIFLIVRFKSSDFLYYHNYVL